MTTTNNNNQNTGTRSALSQRDYIDGVFRGKLESESDSPPTLNRFYVINIPKTGGESVLLDSPNHLLQGQTMSLATPSTPRESSYMDVVFLRDPLSHVLAQFLECKYAKWARQMTGDFDFPGFAAVDQVMEGFDEWVAHAVQQNHSYAGATDFYFCHEPWNMMTRHMTSHRPRYSRTPGERFPSLEVAQENLREDEQLMVGLWEHYEASMCLLEYHALDATYGNFTEGCRRICEVPREKEQQQPTSGSLRTPYHSTDMITNTTTLQNIEKLTAVDQQLYEVAHLLFHGEVDLVRRATGVDLLCRGPSMGHGRHRSLEEEEDDVWEEAREMAMGGSPDLLFLVLVSLFCLLVGQLRALCGRRRGERRVVYRKVSTIEVMEPNISESPLEQNLMLCLEQSDSEIQTDGAYY